MMHHARLRYAVNTISPPLTKHINPYRKRSHPSYRYITTIVALKSRHTHRLLSTQITRSSRQQGNEWRYEGKRQFSFIPEENRWFFVPLINIFLFVVGSIAFLKIYYAMNKEEGEVVRNVGTSLIGGPFVLVDHEGELKSSYDFDGQYRLMYFGFGNCPDICPTELTKISKVMTQIEKFSPGKVVPMFITLDPWRDNVQQMSNYVKQFHPKLIGLTGTPKQTKDVAREFRVFSSIVPAGDDDYVVDHSMYSFLMDKDGSFIRIFVSSLTAEEIVDIAKKDLLERGDVKLSVIERFVKWVKCE
eukprot:TRINITY_DN2976_c0_g2_i1.p1 TRINITY_DN2976_c0_g2~~TRINITY_DN2976_c0_g2_i1.p1  ORF type:complete len:302 (-),score=47.54 TRINITY_DN2976_c0_g2_i1:18-923(-)